MYPDGRMESQVRITSPQTYKEFSRCILNNHSMVSGKGRVPNSSWKSLIPTLVVASDPLVVPLRKLRRECSRSGPSDGMTPIDDIHEL